ncbi:unnamed protein product [Closterium sp. Naga37s-1]|nr:unnamed protein product [Closterium sp. Naga37s-1]
MGEERAERGERGERGGSEEIQEGEKNGTGIYQKRGREESREARGTGEEERRRLEEEGEDDWLDGEDAALSFSPSADKLIPLIAGAALSVLICYVTPLEGSLALLAGGFAAYQFVFFLAPLRPLRLLSSLLTLLQERGGVSEKGRRREEEECEEQEKQQEQQNQQQSQKELQQQPPSLSDSFPSSAASSLQQQPSHADSSPYLTSPHPLPFQLPPSSIPLDSSTPSSSHPQLSTIQFLPFTSPINSHRPHLPHLPHLPRSSHLPQSSNRPRLTPRLPRFHYALAVSNTSHSALSLSHRRSPARSLVSLIALLAVLASFLTPLFVSTFSFSFSPSSSSTLQGPLIPPPSQPSSLSSPLLPAHCPSFFLSMDRAAIALAAQQQQGAEGDEKEEQRKEQQQQEEEQQEGAWGAGAGTAGQLASLWLAVSVVMTVQFAAAVAVGSEAFEEGALDNTSAVRRLRRNRDSLRGNGAEAEAAAVGWGAAAAVAASSEAFEEGIFSNPPLSETTETPFDRGALEEAAGRVGGMGREQMEEESSGHFPGDDLCGFVEERKLLAWNRPGSSTLPIRNHHHRLSHPLNPSSHLASSPLFHPSPPSPHHCRHALFASLGTIATISLILTLSAALALTLPDLLFSLISSLPSPPFLSTASQSSSSQFSSSSSTSPSVDDRRLMPASASLTLTRVLALVCLLLGHCLAFSLRVD